MSQTQTNGSLEAVGNQDVRLVIKTETHLWGVIQSGHSHLGSHCHTHLRNSSFSSCLSLLSSHTLSHEATQHTLDHRVLHCVCNGIADRCGDTLTKVNRSVSAHPLV